MSITDLYILELFFKISRTAELIYSICGNNLYEIRNFCQSFSFYYNKIRMIEI